MWLLNTGTFEIKNFTDAEVPQYAILSHRWGQGEVVLHEVKEGIFRKEECNRPGLKKARRFCSKAKSDGYEYAWIDTCCIDKTSSAELSEAINSMYRWYSTAEKCYAYLADVWVMDQFQKSDWFTRGFTLQELIAPSEVYFFNANWDFLGTKATLQEAVSNTTNIPIEILSGQKDLETASIAQRMSWAAKRNTTRVEDRAYSLMGIFGIYMPLIYGEGERAFTRLQEEIMRVSDDQSLFAWRHDDSCGGLLAISPAAFEGSENIVPSNLHSSTAKPTVISNLGTFLELPFSGIGERALGLAILNCKERGSQGTRIAIYLRDVSWTMQRFERTVSHRYEQLEMWRFEQSRRPIRTLCIKTRQVSRNKNKTKSDMFAEEEEEAMVYNEGMIIELVDFDWPEALIHAMKGRDRDAIWVLLTHSDWEVDLEEPEQQKAFLRAAETGYITVVRMLPSRSGQIGPENKAASAALLCAVDYGHQDIVEMLLDAEPNTEIRNAHGRTPLSVAVKYGDGAIVKMLVNAGAKVDACDHTYKAPLHWAASYGHESPTLTLIDAGANLEKRDNNSRTPLFSAARNGNGAVVKMLVNAGAVINTKDVNGRTPLNWAASNGHESPTLTLIDAGADLETRDDDLRTPLFWAAKNEHRNIVKLLIEKGAKTGTTDRFGQSP
ncbi:Ankyrin repeat-containing domain protein [Moelleriella libera RCEF 2490]|uniref:Ankyrin repeat-containing domain protein n=1 Tax=Moelleriella libera RCEF 2490 TaxID=1081109 RepID=A0A166PAZ7_9HYPO|nr:Ankyrin repeat-containing domain protein [Moelleriella libera RCEF 2490]